MSFGRFSYFINKFFRKFGPFLLNNLFYLLNVHKTTLS